MKDKLIKLLEDICEKYAPCEMDVVADNLIANGVTIPVLCKDCRHCDPENRHCDHPMGTALPMPRKSNDFCSYGERRTDGL